MAMNKGDRHAYSEYIDAGGKTSVMRLFHYFSRNSDYFDVKKEEGSKVIMGSSPHTDWGYLTLIIQDDVGGLQLMHKGEWIDVPYVENSIIVNAGDFLSLISGGRYQSPVHRVLTPEKRDRTSFVLFYYPKYETPMNPALFTFENDPQKESTEKLSANIDISGEQHNSLFVLSDSNDSVDHEFKSFGDYIVEKWRGVKAY